MFGLLNLYKPSGPTSRDCVNQVQRCVRPVKVGHTGTLDPIASGVLLILVGNATRLTDEFHSLDKEYVGTFRLGVSSPSVDTETEITELVDAPRISFAELEGALDSFRGEIEQTPPIYSAVRIGGKRAHALARNAESVEMPTRRIQIDELELLGLDYPTFQIRVVCSTGTYIRSLGRDIARSLGSDGVMTELVRTRIGNQRIEESCKLEELTSVERIESSLLPPQTGLNNLPLLALDDALLTRFQNGQKIPEPLLPSSPNSSQSLIIDQNGTLKGVIQRIEGTEVWRTEKFFL